MAEEAAQAPEGTQDTPQESAPQVEDTRESDAPQEDTASEEQQDTDWRKRYEDLRPEYDRGQQALKEAQQYQQVVTALQSDDPQERAWAADILGLEFEDDEEGDTPDEEEEQYLDPRVDQLLAEREEQAYEQQLDSLERHLVSTIDELNDKHKSDLSQEEKDLVFATALSIPPTDDGTPDIAKAFEQITGIFDNRIKKYRGSKQGAPSPPAPGSSGANAPDLSDRKSRLAAANEVAQRALMREQ